MKLKQKIPLWAVRCVGWGAVFALTIGCKKEDPCGSSFCCGVSPQQLRYVQTVENARAYAWPDGLIIEGFDKYAPSFCIQQRGLYDDVLVKSDTTTQSGIYKFRVWGEMYLCNNCPIIAVGPGLHYIKINKIETLK